MAEFKDYYQVLQVHHLAEPEVIEGAYKRLVKKYHPDLNPGSGTSDLMRDINIAYDVLRDPIRRKEYHLHWQQKNISQTESKPGSSDLSSRFIPAKKALDHYFRAIVARDFNKAYDLIAEHDKTLISKDDFVNWQREVAKVFELNKFHCEGRQIRQNQVLRGRMYPEVAEFQTMTVELNIVMDRMEKDEFPKKVVLDNGDWKVFLGYEGLQPYIQKFQKLAKLITAKSLVHEQVEAQGKIDSATGLFNPRGFSEQVQNELFRFQRYGNVFSVVFFEINLSGNNTEESLKKFGQILAANLRQLDVIGRLDELKLAVLLPETALFPAVRVAVKIREIARLAKLNYTGTWCTGTNCGVVEGNLGTATEIFRWADYYLNFAKRNGINKIASANGIV